MDNNKTLKEKINQIGYRLEQQKKTEDAYKILLENRNKRKEINKLYKV
ncbi:hypothetical protein [Alkaliphilus serpentinus]|nr:hypothetical protein [Alkaliphilus serpentinus]